MPIRNRIAAAPKQEERRHISDFQWFPASSIEGLACRQRSGQAEFGAFLCNLAPAHASALANTIEYGLLKTLACCQNAPIRMGKLKDK
jgi:hypothetical protein